MLRHVAMQKLPKPYSKRIWLEVSRKPWYHPYDAGFRCIISAEAVESWWLPPRFQRTPGSRVTWAESLQAFTEYMMWENEAEDTVRILRNYIFQEHGIFT